MITKNQNDLVGNEEEDTKTKSGNSSLPPVVNIQIMKSSDSESLNDDEDPHQHISAKAKQIVDSSNLGTFPNDQRLDKIFQRITSQLDFLNKTASMMTYRMDVLQKDIDFLKKENNLE